MRAAHAHGFQVVGHAGRAVDYAYVFFPEGPVAHARGLVNDVADLGKPSGLEAVELPYRSELRH